MRRQSVDLAVGGACRDADRGGLADHDVRAVKGRQLFDDGADTRAELRASLDAERHVCAHSLAYRAHLGGLEHRAEHRVQSHDDRSAVGASSRKSRLRGYALVDVDMHAPDVHLTVVKEAVCRLGADVAVIAGHALVIARDRDPAAVVVRQGDHVVQIHRLHDGGDIMVAVGALAEHLERQIDFGGRLDLNFHFSVPQETLGSSRARFSGA